MCSENTSGQGELAIIPDEIKRWNMGAFWFSWIWGIFNRSYVALLALIPILNFIVPFYLGAKGNELAWRNIKWVSVDELKAEQRLWSIGAWIIIILLVFGIGIRFINLSRSEDITANITSQVLNKISENEEVNKMIGKDYTILFEPALQTVTTSQGELPMGHTIFIEGSSGIVFVYTSLDKDYSIKEITISPPDDGKKIMINAANQ